MTTNPSNYTRESHGRETTIKARYAGACHHCGEPTQATPRKTIPETTKADLWVRCRDCGSITRVYKDGKGE